MKVAYLSPSHGDCRGGAGSSHRAPARSADDDDMRSSIYNEEDSADEGEDGSDDTESESPRQIMSGLVNHKYQNS